MKPLFLSLVLLVCFLGISNVYAEGDAPVEAPVEVLAPIVDEVVTPEPTVEPTLEPIVDPTAVTTTEEVAPPLVTDTPSPIDVAPEPVVIAKPIMVPAPVPRVIGTGPTGVPRPLTAPLYRVPLQPPEGAVLGEKIRLIDALLKEVVKGSRSQKVVDLQNELKALGFFPLRVVSSGLYGPITEAAVKKYLASKNVFGGQVLGEKTLDVDEVLGKVHAGEKSEAVRQLQNALKSLGLFPAATPSTGWYGPVTEAAVKKYLANKK